MSLSFRSHRHDAQNELTGPSDTLPGLPTQEQILEMRAKGTQPTRSDGAMIENAQAATTERFNHVHTYHEHPRCAMEWYVTHLGARTPQGRGGAAPAAQAEASDAAEDAAHGPDVRGDELPAELQRREERLAQIAAAKARLEARQADEDRQKGRTPDDGRKSRGSRPFARDFGVPPDTAQDNFTDPERRIMKTSAGYDQCYNGQLAVDEASQMIVATGLTNCAADYAELLPLIDQAHATLGEYPSDVLADAGDRAEATFQTLETHDITADISLGREGKPGTTPNPAHEATQRMAARLASEVGRARYRRRKAIVEPVIGWINEVLGFRRFSLRGEAKARGEWNVVCLAVNLKRFHRISLA